MGMREKIQQIADYYFETGMAMILKTDTRRNTENTQAYHGFDAINGRFLNIVAIELPSVTQPMIASDRDLQILSAHVEHLGETGFIMPEQLELMIFFCEEENLWYRMDIEQLKEYWTTKNILTVSIRDLEKEGLVSIVRNTVYGPDILNLITRPFQVIKSKDDWLTSLPGSPHP